MNKHSKSILLKFVLSFTVIMAVPISFMMILMLTTFSSNRLNQINSDITKGISEVTEAISIKMDTASNIKLVLEGEKQFYDFYIQDDAGYYVYITEALAESLMQGSGFQEILFYSSTTDMITGLANYQMDNYLALSNMPDELGQYLSTIETNWTPIYTMNQSGRNVELISYVVPFETDYNDRSKSVSNLIFTMETEVLDELFSPVAFFENSHYKIKYNGEILYYSNDIIANTDTSAEMESIEGEEYFITKVMSADNIEVIYFTEYSVITDELYSSIQINLAYCVASLALGIILITFFVKYNYTPIQKLNRSIETLGLDMEVSGEYFENLSTFLEDISISSNKVALENIKTERESFVLKLLSTSFTYQKKEDVFHICDMLGIEIKLPYFLCIIFEFETMLPRNTLDVMSKQKEYNCYECRGHYGNRVTILITSPSADKSIIDDIIADVKSIAEITIKGIGVSEFKTSYSMISECYKQALTACKANCNEPELFTQYKNIVEKGSADINNILYQSELLNTAVSQKDFDSILLYYNDIVLSLKAISDYNNLRIFCFEIASKSIKSYEEYPWSKKNKLNQYLYRLFDDNGTIAEDPLQVLTELIKEIANSVFDNTQSIGKKLSIEEFMQNINENYLEPTFSIKALAVEYNVTISNLSHFFKKNTGETLSDYIGTLKLNTVKKMLVETDLSVQHISEYVGYMHTSNFIKKFKASEGVTPQQYRKMNKCDNE